MNSLSRYFRLPSKKLRYILCFLFGLISSSTSASTVFWYEDARGFEAALSQAQRKDKPLVVYFKTDWCKYCKKFESEYLTEFEIDLVLSRQYRVKLNPEHGAEEQKIADHFAITGYPYFIVIHPDREQATKISPLRKGKDWSVDRFKQALLAAFEGN
ncbi:thioredoxin family protein [Corallincola spongiicola]|uniref:Thioredoxin family protein n=1 Tax=Corallincola spongiicola TaxID=2520508 RepID=A0ABY1WQI5_9GAMM|nr:thioredoxin family protein [Corallincola spongiicola]TAA46982.1 thioredoxin family protein [Corallincola spongiicola]